MATLIDSYPIENRSAFWGLSSAGQVKHGQSFHVTNKANLASGIFYGMKSGLPTGNAVAKLYAHSGTFGTSSVPTGDALATSGNFDVSTVSDSDYSSMEFTFSTPYEMQADTNYVMVLEFAGGDGNNVLYVGLDHVSPAHSGNMSSYSTSWSAYSAYDLIFYVYGDLVATSSPQLMMCS